MRDLNINIAIQSPQSVLGNQTGKSAVRREQSAAQIDRKEHDERWAKVGTAAVHWRGVVEIMSIVVALLPVAFPPPDCFVAPAPGAPQTAARQMLPPPWLPGRTIEPKIKPRSAMPAPCRGAAYRCRALPLLAEADCVGGSCRRSEVRSASGSMTDALGRRARAVAKPQSPRPSQTPRPRSPP